MSASQDSKPIDPERVRRALGLQVDRVSNEQYRVEGTDVDYYVQASPVPLCYCRDSVYRMVLCKHVLASLLAFGDESVRAVAESVASDPAVARARWRSVGEERDLPSDMPVSELMGLLEVNPSDIQLAGRIITDPTAQPDDFVRVAEMVDDVNIHTTITMVPRAASHAPVRRALGGTGAHVSVIARLLPYAEDDEFRSLFRELLAQGKEHWTIQILLENEYQALGKLEPADLGALFTSEDREVREKALALIPLLGKQQESKEMKAPERVVLKNNRSVRR